MSVEREQQEITQTTIPEIEQPHIKEFEQISPHPDVKSPDVKSQDIDLTDPK
jgi:hypothetical protein